MLKHRVLHWLIPFMLLLASALGFQPAAITATGAAALASPPGPTVELVNSLGGNITTLALSGTVAYVGEGMSLVALDVSNPAQPARRASLLLPATVRGLQVVSGTAYIADDGQGLQIVDVRNPDALVKLSSYATAEAATSISVVNQRAYLACGAGGLLILDVSDPAHPAKLGAYAGAAQKVWVAGNLAAIIDGDLRLLDVSDPAQPVLRGSYLTPGVATTVQISGSVAYIADGGLGMAAIDISQPISPTLLASTGGFLLGAGAVSVAGHYAYVQNFDYYFMGSTVYCLTQVWEVSDPSQPTRLGAWSRVTDSGPCSGNVQAAGSQVYAANGDFQIVDLTTPLTPTVVGSYLPLKSSAVAMAGSLAYVADEDQRLMILDMANPLQPVVLSSYSTAPGIPVNVQVWGTHAYVTTQDPSHPHFPSGRLLMLEVSNPYSPTLCATYYTGGDGRFSVQGDRVYVMVGHAGFGSVLDIVDVSQPFSPTVLGSYGPGYGNYVSLVAATPAFVYLNANNNGVFSLQVLDVSQPATSVVRGSAPISPVVAAEVKGTVVYAALGAEGLQMFEVSDPLAPHWQATYAPSGTVSLVTVAGENAYVATGGTNLQILDIHAPFSPTLRAAFSAPNPPAAKLQVVGDTIYLVDAEQQLQIFRYTPRVSATLTSAAGALVSAPDATRYAFAAQTFTGTVTVKHTVRAAANLPGTGDLIGIGHHFELTAVDSGTQQSVQPGLPYTLTIQYTEAELGVALENTLGLYYWEGGQWVQEPSAILETTPRTITAHPTHFSFWAVLGQTRRAYLPFVSR